MKIGVHTFELHLPSSRSLKEKRQVVRRLKDRLRSRFNVSIAELPEHQQLWQRAGLMVVGVAAERDALERMFESIREECEKLTPGSVIELAREVLDGT